MLLIVLPSLYNRKIYYISQRIPMGISLLRFLINIALLDCSLHMILTTVMLRVGGFSFAIGSDHPSKKLL